MASNWRVYFDFKNERLHIDFGIIEDINLDEDSLIISAKREIAHKGYPINECSNISSPVRTENW